MREQMNKVKNFGQFLNENVSDNKFENAFNRVKSYIDFTLKTEEQINEYVPNTHIAETFKDTLKLMEIENLYPEEFKKIGDDQVKYFKITSVVDIVLNDFNQTNLTPMEIERVYQLRRDKHDFIRQNLKLIHTRLPDYALSDLSKKTIKTNKIIIK